MMLISLRRWLRDFWWSLAALLAWLTIGAALLVSLSSCVSTPEGRRLHPLAAIGAEAACLVAAAAAGIPEACAGITALRLAVEAPGQLWYCVAYPREDVEAPELAVQLDDGRVGVCWADPADALEAAAEVE